MFQTLRLVVHVFADVDGISDEKGLRNMWERRFTISALSSYFLRSEI